MTKTTVLNVRLPKDQLEFLDVLVKQGLFRSRSDAIREFSRQYVKEQGGGMHV